MKFLRDLVVFLAGGEFFHTLSHIWLAYSGLLPLQMKHFILSPHLNVYAIIGNAAVAIVLLLIARKMKR